MTQKSALFFILFLFPFYLLAQKVELSHNANFVAAYFQNIKDSVVFVKENNNFKEKKVFFAKYRIVIFDKKTATELYKYETPIFQLSKDEPNIKLRFDKNDRFLYAAIENKEVIIFDMQKGFSAKYKAQDFCFSSDSVQVAVLQQNKIFFLQEGKEIKRKFEGFTTLEYTKDDKFIVASRKLKNKTFFVFVEVEKPKNSKTINANTYAYSSENEEIYAYKSSKILIYKTSNFKSKEIDLNKKIQNKNYKKYADFAQFSKDANYLLLLSKHKFYILSSKGKKIKELEKASDFVGYKWLDNNILSFVFESKTLNYNIQTDLISDETDFKFEINSRIVLFDKNEKTKNLFCLGKVVVLNAKNGFIFRNILTKEQAFTRNEYFIDFSKDKKYFFTEKKQNEIKIYQIDSFFGKKDVLTLSSEPIKMLSSLSAIPFLHENEKKYYSPDLKIIATTYSSLRVDSIFHPSQKSFDEIYREWQKNKNTKINPIVITQLEFSDGLVLFDTQDRSSSKFLVSLDNKALMEKVDYSFFGSPLIQERYKSKMSKESARRLYRNLSGLNDKTINDLRITNKKTLLVRQNYRQNYEVIDIDKNESLNVFKAGSVFFSPNNTFVIVKTNLKTILYNAVSGKEINSYNSLYSNILLTNDTSFFIGMNEAKNYEFVGNDKTQDLNSSIVKMTKNGKFLLVIEKNKTNLKLYSLPDLKLLSSNYINPKYKKYFYNPQIEVSENATYFSCLYKNSLLILSTIKDSEKQIYFGNVLPENASLWINDKEIIISNNESNLIFNAEKEVFDKNKNFNFYFSASVLNSLSGKEKRAFVSPNAKIALLELTKDRQTDLYLKNTSQKYKNYFIANADFIAFDNNSQRVYFQQGKDKIGFVETKDILEGKANLQIKYIKGVNTRTRNLPPRPSVIENDFPAPEGYHYERFTEIKNIDNLDEKIGMYVLNLISKGNNIKLNLHLLNSNGVFYTSSGKEKNKDIWCELWIKYPNGKVKKVENFSVSEQIADSKQNKTNFALALVLDHSGSMGKNRCLYQEKGVKYFIEAKRKNDAISLLKFDENVKTELLLNTSKNTLLSKLIIDGGKDFGGSTALYDAIYEGITEVSKISDNRKKALIVITDGYENSSYTYLNELILYALENHVQIHIIGFGLFINKPVLQTISYQTGGSFYQIYDTKNFSWIFKDVFNKLSNFYSINFATPQKGKYTIMLKSCSEKIKNKIILSFDNSEINFGQLNEFGEDGFGIPFIDLSDSLDLSVFENSKPIPNIDKIVSKNGSNLDFYAKKEFETIKFPDIKFLTNKTTIIKGTDKGLDDVILFLKKHPQVNIEISGHTDEVGNDNNNLILSENRAEKVKAILVKAGIQTYRIQTVGYGETKPVASNKTQEGKLKNRRVEFKIIK